MAGDSMFIIYRYRKLIATLFAMAVFLAIKRMGVSIIAFLLVFLFLEEAAKLNIKMLIYLIFAIGLFSIGHKLSLRIALSCIAPLGDFAWTFTGGFIGGVIELETYLLFTLFPMKLIYSRNLKSSCQYILRMGIICFIIGGLIQGSYMAGWQGLFHI